MIQSGSGLGEVRSVGTPGHNTRYRIECRILPILMLSYRHTSYMEHLEHQKTDTRLFPLSHAAKSLRELGRYQFCFMSPLFIFYLWLWHLQRTNLLSHWMQTLGPSRQWITQPVLFLYDKSRQM